MGLLYVLDGRSGFVKHGFPMQFGEIQSQVAVGDIVDTDKRGHLEMVFGDLNGNLICLSYTGKVEWDRRLPGACASTPSLGDVDGDGVVDVVCLVTSTEGETLMYAMNGRTGKDLEHFPIRCVGVWGGAGWRLASAKALCDMVLCMWW